MASLPSGRTLASTTRRSPARPRGRWLGRGLFRCARGRALRDARRATPSEPLTAPARPALTRLRCSRSADAGCDRPAASDIDQRRVAGPACLAGLGNIWRNETLFAERVDPFVAVADVDDERLDRVIATAQRLLTASAGVAPGRAPTRVYRKTGRPCPRCGTPIRSAPLSAEMRGRRTGAPTAREACDERYRDPLRTRARRLALPRDRARRAELLDPRRDRQRRRRHPARGCHRRRRRRAAPLRDVRLPARARAGIDPLVVRPIGRQPLLPRIRARDPGRLAP